MKRFQVDQLEILVPHIYGVSTKPTGRGQWTEEEFFQVLEEKNEPNIVNLVRDIYRWSLQTADRIWFGTGREIGSFTFHYLKDGKTVSVFTVYTNGKLTLNYGWLKDQVYEETIREFHKRMHEIPTLQHIPDNFSKWPSVKVEALKEPQNLEKFKNAIQWLKTQIKTQI